MHLQSCFGSLRRRSRRLAPGQSSRLPATPRLRRHSARLRLRCRHRRNRSASHPLVCPFPPPARPLRPAYHATIASAVFVALPHSSPSPSLLSPLPHRSSRQPWAASAPRRSSALRASCASGSSPSSPTISTPASVSWVSVPFAVRHSAIPHSHVAEPRVSCRRCRHLPQQAHAQQDRWLPDSPGAPH